VTVCSDNRTVIKAISNPYTKNSQVHDIYVEVFKAKTKDISIDLLESFQSDVNERLNQTKQKAIEAMDSHSRIAYDLISESYIKRLLNKRNTQKWQQIWQTSETGQQTKLFFPTIQSRLKFNKDIIFGDKTTQILTNHGSFNAYLKRFCLKEQDYCDDCIGAEDDANHRLFYCQKYENQRNDFKEKVLSSGHSWPPAHNILIQHVLNDFIEFTQHLV
jgi:hypothetical protein